MGKRVQRRPITISYSHFWTLYNGPGTLLTVLHGQSYLILSVLSPKREITLEITIGIFSSVVYLVNGKAEIYNQAVRHWKLYS